MRRGFIKNPKIGGGVHNRLKCLCFMANLPLFLMGGLLFA